MDKRPKYYYVEKIIFSGRLSPILDYIAKVEQVVDINSSHQTLRFHDNVTSTEHFEIEVGNTRYKE